MAQLHGVIVMSVAGAVVWVGWLNKLNGVPLAKLCNTVASFFKREGGHQNSSYLDAGTFAAASTTDGENIISVVCSLSCPETEVLLKAREISHVVKLLYGPNLKDVAAPEYPEQAEDTDLHRLLLRVLQVPTAARPPFPFSVVRWLNEHGSHNDLSSHFLQRLCTVSPCSAAFSLIEQAPGFICTHFIDVTEPGEVLLSHWYQPGKATGGGGSASSSLSVSPSKTATGGKAGAMGVLRTLGKDVMQAFNSTKATRPRMSTVTSVQQLMARPISSLWTIIMRESRNLAALAAQSRRTVPVGAAAPAAPTAAADVCTVDLSDMVASAAATICLVQLQHYEAAFVVIYTASGIPTGPRGSPPFHVTYGADAVPRAVMQQLVEACQDVKQRFPVTRDQLLQIIWPQIPLSENGDSKSEGDQQQSGVGEMQQRGTGWVDPVSSNAPTQQQQQDALQGAEAAPSSPPAASQPAATAAAAAAVADRPSADSRVSPRAVAPPVPPVAPPPLTAVLAAGESAAGGATSPTPTPRGGGSGSMAPRGAESVSGAVSAGPSRRTTGDPPSLGQRVLGALGMRSFGRSSPVAAVGPAPGDTHTRTPAPSTVEPTVPTTTHTDHTCTHTDPSHLSHYANNTTSVGVENTTVVQKPSQPTVHRAVQSASEVADQGGPHAGANDGTQGHTHTATHSNSVSGRERVVEDLRARRDPSDPVFVTGSVSVGVVDTGSDQGHMPGRGTHGSALGHTESHTRAQSAGSIPSAAQAHVRVQHRSEAPGHAAVSTGSHEPHMPQNRVLAAVPNDQPLHGPTHVQSSDTYGSGDQKEATGASVPRSGHTAHTQAHRGPLQPVQPISHNLPTHPPNADTVPSKPRPPSHQHPARPPSPNLWRRHSLGARDTHSDTHTTHSRQHPAPGGWPQTDSDDKENGRDQQGHHQPSHSPHRGHVGRRRGDAGKLRHHLADGGGGVGGGSVKRKILGLASATDLLQGSFEREENRRLRLQLLYDGIAYRQGLLGGMGMYGPGVGVYGPAGVWGQPQWLPPPAAAPQLYGAAQPQPQPWQHTQPQPPQYPAAPTHAAYEQQQGAVSPPHSPSHTTAAGHTTVHIHASNSPHTQPHTQRADTHTSPRPPAMVLVAPQGPPSPVPYDIWQLFNGRWYQLVSSGEWVPSGSPPHTHRDMSPHAARAAHTQRGGLSHGSNDSTAVADRHAASPPRAAAQVSAPPSSPAAGYAAATSQAAVAPQASQLARDIAVQLLQELQRLVHSSHAGDQGGHLSMGSHATVSSLLLSPQSQGKLHKATVSPRDTGADTQRARDTVKGGAGLQAAAHIKDGVGGGVGDVGGTQYYMGPGGSLYCCAQGQWYQINPRAA